MHRAFESPLEMEDAMKTLTCSFILLLCLAMLSGVSGCDVPGDESGADPFTASAVEAPGAPPVYMPEHVSGEFLFAVDASGDAGIVDPVTGRSGYKTAATDIVAALHRLTKRDYFEVMTYGGATTTDFCFGSFVQANSANVAMAANYLNNFTPSGPSPQYSALRDAIAASPASLTALYFYSASLPGADPAAPQGMATPAVILQDFPHWWASLTGAELVAVRVGNWPAPHASYLQQLAALAGGVYIHLP
jgi:hypothetical protein